jgi:non-specific serine/threonine protein kinase
MLAVEQGELARGRALLEQSIELSRKLGYKSNLAWALNHLGGTASMEGNRAEARSLWEESLAVAREIGSKWITAVVLRWLGSAQAAEGAYQSGISMLEESLTLAREVGDNRTIAGTLNALGEVARRQGDYQRALGFYEGGLALARQARFKNFIVSSLSNIGYILLSLGERERAYTSFMEGLQIAGRELGDKEITARCLAGLAGVAIAWEEPEKGARMVGAANGLIAASGSTLADTDQRDYDLIVAMTKAQLDEETWQKAWDEGRYMKFEQAVACAQAQPMAKEPDLVPQNVPSSPSGKVELGGLTSRELEVADLIAQSKSNAEIAEALVVSKRTVETHITQIFSKLGFTSRGQIAVWAIKKGLISQSD